MVCVEGCVSYGVDFSDFITFLIVNFVAFLSALLSDLVQVPP